MSIAFELASQRQGRALLGVLGKRFATAPGGGTRDRRTHYDTFDWRLAAAGVELTAERRGDGWLLSWRRAGEEAGRSILADAEPGFARELPPKLRQRLVPIVEMRRLLPRIELERRRREVRLLDRREKTVARLRLEGTRVRPAGGGRVRRLPARLVALPVKGFDRAFARLVRFLEDQGLERETRPLVERAYAACGLEPGDYSAKVQVPLDPEMPAHLALRRIHRQLLEVIRRNEAGLRQDLDSEFLHDYRVAVRRSRAALTQVKGVYPAARARRFRRGLSWLGKLTGPLRDFDVYRLKLDDYRGRLPAEVSGDLAPLAALLERRQRSEQRRVARALGGRRYERLVDDWTGFLAEDEVPGTPRTGLRPIAEVAGERILAAHARVLERGRAIDSSTPDDKLHRLRIDCKKLRYLLELFADLYEPRAISQTVKALKGLQDNLGDFNDLSVQQAAMRGFAEELVEEGAPATTVVALGRLIATLERRQGEERRRFHDRFARFARPRVARRLLAQVEGGGR